MDKSSIPTPRMNGMHSEDSSRSECFPNRCRRDIRCKIPVNYWADYRHLTIHQIISSVAPAFNTYLPYVLFIVRLNPIDRFPPTGKKNTSTPPYSLRTLSNSFNSRETSLYLDNHSSSTFHPFIPIGGDHGDCSIKFRLDFTENRLVLWGRLPMAAKAFGARRSPSPILWGNRRWPLPGKRFFGLSGSVPSRKGNGLGRMG